jgi:hypothetical protein
VWEQSEGLEDESYVSVFWRDIVDKFFADVDLAFVRADQSSYQSEERGFSAAAWAQEGEVFRVMDVEAYVVYRD